MQRTTRYQGAILQRDCILLIRYRDPVTERAFWLLPGGGLEAGETETECVQREMWEETNLSVRVEGLLVEEEDLGGLYQTRKTYLCYIEDGSPSPGYEPEVPVASGYGIVETGWFSLNKPEEWGEEVDQDSITYTQLVHIQKELGY